MHSFFTCIVSLSVTTFWAALSLLLLFAYPTPEFPTPSYEFHTAFDGVALGIVSTHCSLLVEHKLIFCLNKIFFPIHKFRDAKFQKLSS